MIYAVSHGRSIKPTVEAFLRQVGSVPPRTGNAFLSTAIKTAGWHVLVELHFHYFCPHIGSESVILVL